MTNSAQRIARKAGNHPIVEAGARLGYAASGVLHLVLAWLALQLAFGSVILWLLLAGFVLLGLWQLTEVVALPAKKKLKPLAKAIVYVVLAVSTVSVLYGASANSNQQTEGFTATAMSSVAGVWIVGAVGLAVVGIGLYHVVKAAKQGFLKDLKEHPPQWIVRIAQVGYVAKGVALAAVGLLFLVAATTHDPSKAGGLDAGLRSLLNVPEGVFVLAAVAIGLACYGVYSFARAKYARV
jgi:Domain of Unknown Function (DUF1206)